MKKLFLILLLFVPIFCVYAQDSNPIAVENQFPNDETANIVYQKAVDAMNNQKSASSTTWIGNRGRDNWFISISGGIGQLMSEDTREMDFGDQIKPTFGFALGRWISPVWGIRLNITGAKLQGFAPWEGVGKGRGSEWYTGYNYRDKSGSPDGFTSTATPEGAKYIMDNYLKTGKVIKTDKGDGYAYDFTYGAASLDLLLNLKNLFMPYNPKAVFNPVLYGGVGYAHTFKDGNKTAVNNMMGKAGLMLNFRLSDQWDIFADGQILVLPESFDHRVGGDMSVDGVGNYSLGFTYKFNFRHFIKAPMRDQSEIDALNSEINMLRNRPEKVCPPQVVCPDCPDCSDVERIKYLPSPVFFSINSAEIRDAQLYPISEAARFLKENPNARIKVTGYADKKTGNTSINKRLSEQRAKKVHDILVNKYNINPNRIEASYLGDTVQPFEENNWNRVVIFVIP